VIHSIENNPNYQSLSVNCRDPFKHDPSGPKELLGISRRLVIQICELHFIPHKGHASPQFLLSLIAQERDPNFRSFVVPAKMSVRLFSHVLLASAIHGFQPQDFIIPSISFFRDVLNELSAILRPF
jgi:hypothetical protein